MFLRPSMPLVKMSAAYRLSLIGLLNVDSKSCYPGLYVANIVGHRRHRNASYSREILSYKDAVLVGRKMLSGVCLVLSSDPSQSRSILTILLCRVLNERYLLCLLSSHSDTHGTVSGRRRFGTLMTSNHGSLPSLSCGSFSPAVVFIDSRANTHNIHSNIHMYHLIRSSIVTLTFFSIHDRFQMS